MLKSLLRYQEVYIIETDTINAMSYNRRTVISEVKNSAISVVEHIIKRCIYSDSTQYNHWNKEITAMLLAWKRLKLKPNNKRLSLTEFNKIIDLWLDNPKELDERIKDLIKEGRLQECYIKPYNSDKAYLAIRKLINTLIQDVSTGEFLKFDETVYHIPVDCELK